MRTIEKTVFLFDELSDKAKEKAREWYRSIDDGWYLQNAIENDFAEIARIIGLEVENVYYQIGYVQSDYAAIIGRWSYAKGAAKKIREYAPKADELYEIVDLWCDLQRRKFYQLDARLTCLRDCQNVGDTTINGRYTDDDTLDEAQRIASQLAQWLYWYLRDECDSMNSDEAVDESIRTNEYEFYENGERV